jgi:hypothetical protein
MIWDTDEQVSSQCFLVLLFGLRKTTVLSPLPISFSTSKKLILGGIWKLDYCVQKLKVNALIIKSVGKFKERKPGT